MSNTCCLSACGCHNDKGRQNQQISVEFLLGGINRLQACQKMWFFIILENYSHVFRGGSTLLRMAILCWDAWINRSWTAHLERVKCWLLGFPVCNFHAVCGNKEFNLSWTRLAIKIICGVKCVHVNARHVTVIRNGVVCYQQALPCVKLFTLSRFRGSFCHCSSRSLQIVWLVNLIYSVLISWDLCVMSLFVFYF